MSDDEKIDWSDEYRKWKGSSPLSILLDEIVNYGNSLSAGNPPTTKEVNTAVSRLKTILNGLR